MTKTVVVKLALLSLLLATFGCEGSSSSSRYFDGDEELRVFHVPGVVLHKTNGPLDIGPVGDDFPGRIPFEFIKKAFGLNVLETDGAQRIMMNSTIETNNKVCPETDNDDEIVLQFGKAILNKARKMFLARNNEAELESFLKDGVSNPDAGPRRMYWAGLDILPNQSFALHSHPNVEFAYIVQGVMHEWRLVDDSIKKKRKYVPKIIEAENGKNHSKYIGPDLSDIDASKAGIFEHRVYHEGDMFINTIGDVHQSFTRDERVKLFVMWGDGNADVPVDEYPHNASFMNKQTAKAWT